MAENRVSRISISIPSGLLEEFDEVVKRMNWDRSKAVQIAMRNLLTEYRWTREKGSGVGSITMIYDHEVRGLEEMLTDVQHSYESVISSSTHVHLDERNCMKIIAAKGNIRIIQELAQKLVANRGVKQLKVTALTP